MSNSLARKIKRNNEKKELIEIKSKYGRKPKGVCPNCHKKSLFLENEKHEIFCLRCQKIVKYE